MYSKQTYVYKRTKDCDIQADVYRLDDNAVRPVILWVHGGALVMGNRETLAAEQLEQYVGAGYVVVTIDYRLAPETKLDAIIEDLQDAYHWLYTSGAGLFQIDPERIAVIGHSAGGYLTLMTGFRVQPRPRALVSFYGYGDIMGAWYSQPDPFYNQRPPIPADEVLGLLGGAETTGTPFTGSGFEQHARFYLYCRQQGLWLQYVGGHDPFQEADWFTPFCPIRNVTPDYPPTLLVHGDHDTDVPVEQSLIMAEALKRTGVEHELIVIPDGEHGFDGKGAADPVVADVFSRVFRFLEQHMTP